jgi:hypothetical protein
MKKSHLALPPLIGSAVLAACTSTTSSPVVACGPDNVATTNWDVVAATNYEAAWFYASADPIVFGVPVAEAPGLSPDQYAPTPMAPVAPTPSPVPTVPAVPTPTPTPTTAPPSTSSPPADAGAEASLDAGVVAPAADAGVTAPASAASIAAATAIATSSSRYFPNGCATATASGNVVTFKLSNCSGPLGLLASSGTFTATVNVIGSMANLRLAGMNVTANGATIDLSATGTLSVGATGTKTLQVNSQSTGTGPNGNSVAHSGMYTLVWPTGTGCATINGTMSGVGTGQFAGTTTQITNYVTCTNKCPQSGMTVSSFNGGSVTLTFNGSMSAQCNATNGTSASIPLDCP